ncbi:MAG: hypothetical protein AAF242_10390, partial [Bacteroidota bacterium]
MITRIVTFCFFSLISFAAQAQLTAVQRVELELPAAIQNEQVLSLEDNGALLTHFEQDESTHQKRWTFQAFDNELNAQEPLSFFLSRSFQQKFAVYNRLTQQSHHLFINQQKDFKMFTFQWPAGEVKEIQDGIPVGRSIQRMAVYDNLIYFVSRKRGRDHLWTLNLQTQAKAIIPFQHPNFPNSKTRIQKIEILEDNRTVLVYANALVADKPNEPFFGAFQDNQPQNIQALRIGPRIAVENLAAIKMDKDNFLLASSYAHNNNRKSEGIALFNLQGKQVENIQLHTYGSMLEFFSYLPAE